jgi:hypothetical protein
MRNACGPAARYLLCPVITLARIAKRWYSQSTSLMLCRMLLTQFRNAMSGLDREILRRTALRIAFGLLTAVLGACGGGGGGSGDTSTPPPTPQTSFSVSTTALNVTAPYNHTGATGTFSVTALNIPAAGVYYKLSYSTNAITSGGINATASGDTLQVQVAFRAPSSLGIGTYTDIIRVSLCFDSACTNLVNGSPREINVQYIVSAPDATISLTSPSVAVSAFVTESFTTLPLVNFSFTSMPVAVGYFSATSTTTGIDHIEVNNGGFNGWITVWPKAPGTLAPGTYADTIVLTACLDAACVYPLANSPVQVPVSYVVNDTVQGGNGYSVKVVRDVAANAFDTDTVNNKIYAGTTSNSVSNSNSIIAVDPSSAAITRATSLGAEPTAVDVADDSSFAYVGFETVNSVKRYSLPALGLNTTIPLGTSSSPGPLYTKDLQAAPNHARTVAVVRGAIGSYSNELVIFDDTTNRAAYANNTVSFNLVRWGSSWSQVFVGTSEVSTEEVLELAANTSSLALISNTPSILSFNKFIYANGYIYTYGGRVFDPASQSVLGTFGSASGATGAVAIDTTLNRAYFFGGLSGQLSVYDLTTRTMLRSATLPGVSSGFRSKLMRWGTNGLVLSDQLGRLILLSGPFVTQ